MFVRCFKLLNARNPNSGLLSLQYCLIAESNELEYDSQTQQIPNKLDTITYPTISPCFFNRGTFLLESTLSTKHLLANGKIINLIIDYSLSVNPNIKGKLETIAASARAKRLGKVLPDFLYLRLRRHITRLVNPAAQPRTKPTLGIYQGNSLIICYILLLVNNSSKNFTLQPLRKLVVKGMLAKAKQSYQLVSQQQSKGFTPVFSWNWLGI